MKCSQCGNEIDPMADACPFCRQNQPVKVLSKRERDSFRGETIDATVIDSERKNSGQDYYQEYSSPNYKQKVYTFNLIPKSFLGRALAVVLAGVFVFAALPIFFMVVLLGALAWFFLARR